MVHKPAKQINDSTQQLATISDNCSHQALAVWAHILPILKGLIKLDINVVHIQSDGLTSPYKNKSNLFLMTHYAKIVKKLKNSQGILLSPVTGEQARWSWGPAQEIRRQVYALWKRYSKCQTPRRSYQQ